MSGACSYSKHQQEGTATLHCLMVLQALLSLGASSPQPSFQFFKGRGSKKHEPGVEVGTLHLLHALIDVCCQYGSFSVQIASSGLLIRSGGSTYLHFDIQNANATFLSDVLHCLDTGPVVISSELRMFDESILADELKEVILRREVILASVFFARSRCPGRIWIKRLLVSTVR